MSLWPMQRVPAGYWKNAEKHEQRWIDELRDAGIPCTPIPCQVIRISKVKFRLEKLQEQEVATLKCLCDQPGEVVVVNTVDHPSLNPETLREHHRSCALRSGREECTC